MPAKRFKSAETIEDSDGYDDQLLPALTFWHESDKESSTSDLDESGTDDDDGGNNDDNGLP